MKKCKYCGNLIEQEKMFCSVNCAVAYRNEKQCKHLQTTPCFVNQGLGHKCLDCGELIRNERQGD